MDGIPHRIAAAAGWACYGIPAGLPWWQVLGGIPIAAAFAAGPTSPDCDNGWTWKKIDKAVPDEALGHGGPLGHRQLMHWWGLPTALAAVLYLTPGSPWYAWAAVLGWVSHLAGDFICGQAGYGTRQGIPLAPWWLHVGLGFKSGTRAEHVLVPVVALASVVATLVLAVT